MNKNRSILHVFLTIAIVLPLSRQPTRRVVPVALDVVDRFTLRIGDQDMSNNGSETQGFLIGLTHCGWVGKAFLLSFLLTSVGCHVAATAHNLEGKKLFEQGQYNESLARFQEALQDDPMNADAYYNMAAVYHRLGADSGNHQYLSQAEELYRQTLDIDPNHVDGYRGLAVLYVQAGQSASAFNLLEGWVIRNPDSAEPRIELARLHKEQGDPMAARDHLSAALERDSSNSRALRALGQLREEQGDYVAALDMYNRSIQLNSMQSDLTAHVASLRQSLGVTNATSPTVGPGTRIVDAGVLPNRY